MIPSSEKTNYRELHALPSGTIIRCNGTQYTIVGKPIGYGGSSILYAAEETGTKITMAIKEFFPGSPNDKRFIRSKGIIRPVDTEDAIAMALMDHFRLSVQNEAKISQLIFNSSIRAVPTWKVLYPTEICVGSEVFTDIAEGIFSLQPRFDVKARSLEDILQDIDRNCPKEDYRKTKGLPNIHLTACLIEEVLNALLQIHKARDPEDPKMQGFYYGDLHPKNVFFAESNIANKKVGIAHLLDYGSSLPLDSNGQTKKLVASSVFSTDGFRPPEACEDGEFTLAQQADIYSAGCLLLRCVVSSSKFNLFGRSPICGPSALDELDGKRIGCSGRVLTILNDILDKATKERPNDRYNCVDEMLESICRLKYATKPPTYLLPKAPASSESFIEHSRDKEIDIFRNALKKNEPVFIWGCGGIGKSEIAVKLAQNWNSPKGAYFVHYAIPDDENQEAMEETVLRMPFTDYSFEPKKKDMRPEELRKAEYGERLELLRKEYEGALLVIDNFDWPGKTLVDLQSEQSYGDITSAGLNIVFTTRNDVSWAPDWEVKELLPNELLKLMRRWCTDPQITDQQLLDLIDAVGGHTLTVDLMAKTLSKSRRRITPEQLLDCLKNSKLAASNYPKVSVNQVKKGQEDPARVQHREIKTAQIYEHLKALFDLSGLDELAKEVLCYATLLPDGGMDCQLFESCLTEDQQDALTYLLDCGWLKNSSDNVISIHPVVREVCRQELSPSDSICTPFAIKMTDNHDREHYNYSRYLSMAKWFANAADHLQDIDACFSKYALQFYIDIGQYDNAISYGHTALEKLNQNVQLHAEWVASCNLYVAISYHSLGSHLTALKYTGVALDIIHEHQVSNDSLLASIYTTNGLIMGAMNAHKEQVDWCRMALIIHENSSDEDPRGVAACHNNIALGLEAIGDFENAFAHALAAAQKYCACLNVDHPALAKVLHTAGHIMYTIAEKSGESHLYNLAIDSYFRAETIRMKYLPDNHPDLPALYRDIAKAYRGLKDWEQARTWFQFAAEHNDAYSISELGVMLLLGKSCDPNIPRGIAFLENAVKLGNSDAAYNLGFNYLYGIFSAVDYLKAEQYLVFAADHPYQPNEEACGQLYALYKGLIPGANVVVPSDPEKAVAYLEKANFLGLENISILSAPNEA